MTKIRAQEIIEVPIDQLLKKLTTAYADEWMAMYQYWVGSIIIKGPNRKTVAAELTIHANEELAHAQMIADRILVLGGSISHMPQDWSKLGGCHYDAIKTDIMKPMLEENLKGERCAVHFYNDLLKFVDQKDRVTYRIIETILEDEIEHEQDLINFLEDLELTANL